MRRFVSLAIFHVLFFAALSSSPAHAQATRTWVSGVGDDANPCSLTAPCKTFAGAISKTAAAGEINCLTAGGFGTVTITKAITISCEERTGGITASGTTGITINAGAPDAVTLRGLDIQGNGSGINGIAFNTGKSLTVEKTRINGFKSSGGTGILFWPSVTATLGVTDTIISNNGTTSGGFGVYVRPLTSTNVAFATLNRVTMTSNTIGLFVLSTTGLPSFASVTRSSIADSASTGILTSGGGAVVWVGSSALVNNLGASSSGTVVSNGNNQINGNNPDVTPGVAPTK